MIKLYHQNKLRKARIYDSKYPYFMTICAYNMQDVLTKECVPEIFVESIKWFIANSVILNLGFVIMPNHLHWAFAIRGDGKLDNIMREFKGYTARKIKKLSDIKQKIWQKGYYDHSLRDMKDFKIKLEYMHNNPVRKGIVDKAENYLYSTANERYKGLIDWEYVTG
ncbi:MAG: transposase [Candidatus Omnitrophota bacterium]|nr:transposase [Candidatus Omnitrophota bacterium]